MPIQVMLHTNTSIEPVGLAYVTLGKSHGFLLPVDLCDLLGVTIEEAVELVETEILSSASASYSMAEKLDDAIQSGDVITEEFDSTLEAIKFIKMNHKLMGLI